MYKFNDKLYEDDITGRRDLCKALKVFGLGVIDYLNANAKALFLAVDGVIWEEQTGQDAVELTLEQRQTAAREHLSMLFKSTDAMLAEIENHAKEDALLAGVPFNAETMCDYTPWLEAKDAIRAANPIPTE